MSDVLHMVVVSYENADLTIRAVESLFLQTVSVSVTVWDNNSSDAERTKLIEKCPADSLVLWSENLLWSPAVNRGIAHGWTNEPFVGFMNNDIALPPHAVESMIEVAARREVGIIAPTGSALGGGQDFATHHGQQDYRDAYCARLTPKRTTYVVGACCILRKDVWDEVGVLDEDMPLGADDHDYCIRLKAAGYQIWIDERVYADHAGHASAGADTWNEWGSRGWDRFNEKWAGYYTTKEEAIKCHWGGVYNEGWER